MVYGCSSESIEELREKLNNQKVIFIPKDTSVVDMSSEIIYEEVLKLRRILDLYQKRQAQYILTIDDLSRENQNLRDWKAKWEAKYDSGY